MQYTDVLLDPNTIQLLSVDGYELAVGAELLLLTSEQVGSTCLVFIAIIQNKSMPKRKHLAFQVKVQLHCFNRGETIQTCENSADTKM